MASVDALKAVVTLLQDDTAVAALVGTRVHGGELPRAEASSQARHTALVQYAGMIPGPGTGGNLAFLVYRFDVITFGTTPQKADELRRAVQDAMKGIDRATKAATLIHDATLVGGPVHGRDPDQDWPFMSETYAVAVSECAVT